MNLNEKFTINKIDNKSTLPFLGQVSAAQGLAES